MGKAIPYDYRLKIVEQIKSGASYDALSQEMGYSKSGIKKIWYAFKKEGEASLKNKYINCGRNSDYSGTVRSAVKELRDNGQGGSYIRSKLLQKYPQLTIPSERTLQRWWVKEGSNSKKGRPEAVEKKSGVIKHMTLGK